MAYTEHGFDRMAVALEVNTGMTVQPKNNVSVSN